MKRLSIIPEWHRSADGTVLTIESFELSDPDGSYVKHEDAARLEAAGDRLAGEASGAANTLLFLSQKYPHLVSREEYERVAEVVATYLTVRGDGGRGE